MRKIFILILASLFLCSCSMGNRQHNADILPGVPTGRIPVRIGATAYGCITETSDQNLDNGQIRTFTHYIYDGQNNPVVSLKIAFTIINSGTEYIVETDTALSDPQVDGLSLSEHNSDDMVTVILYQNQASVCYFQYRITSDGSIEMIS